MPKDAWTTSATTPMSYDSFKPKFPLDPFADAGVPTPRHSWSVDTDSLPSLPLLQAERKVIVVIGQPSSNALDPLLQSLHMASSLLIIASHRPYVLPESFQPAIRVLRLQTPIAVEDAGASRLVDVLEWAEQTARLWRKTGGPRYQELVEDLESFDSMKNNRIAGRLRYSVVDVPLSGSSPITPLSSQNSLPTGALTSNKMSKSFGNISGLKRQSGFSMPPADPEQRPFDAIIHFMPTRIPDKMLLKTAILVTTLTRPYLVTTGIRAPATRFWSESAKMPSGASSTESKSLCGNGSGNGNGNGGGGKRWSLFRGRSVTNSTILMADPVKFEKRDRSASTFSSASTTRSLAMYMLRARKSRIIHIMPPSSSRTPSHANAQVYSQQAQAHAEARLIRSIEAFLLSFSFPIPTSTLSPTDPDFQRARPYLLPSNALRDSLSLTPSPSSPVEGKDAETTMFQGEWSLAELVLSGVLDLPYGPEVQAATVLANGEKEKQGQRMMTSETAKGKMKDVEFSIAYDWMAHRAWIASVHEVVVKSGPESALVQTQKPASMQVGVRPRPALPAPASVPVATTRNPSPTKGQMHQPPLMTQRQSPVKGHQISPVKGHPTGITTSPTRMRPHAAAVAMSADKRLPTPPEEVPPALGSTSKSAATTSHLSPNHAAIKIHGNAGNDSSRAHPVDSKPSTSAAPVTVHPYPNRLQAHSHLHAHTQKHAPTTSNARPASADAQLRGRETAREREQREREQRAATYGLPTPPDSDEASGEGIPSPLVQTTSRNGSSNVSNVAVVGNQRRARSAHGHEQTPASRTRSRTESAPRAITAPSHASQSSQGSTVPPTPPAKSASLKRDSRYPAGAAPVQRRASRGAGTEEGQKMLRRRSKHLSQLGHGRTASASSPALVGAPGNAGSPGLSKKRSKWKFWKQT